MNIFFKSFFASLLALVIFSILVLFILFAMAAGLSTGSRAEIEAKSVLVINLNKGFKEMEKKDPFGNLSGEEKDLPGLYDVVRLIGKAATDKNIAGIYLQADGNGNGFAASQELRQAILDFRKSKKFVIAYGEVMTQKTYYVASAADRLYLNPQGILGWVGFNVDYIFFKGTLDKLEIQPQIFYAGKFKSATEPFRVEKMTDENRLQTTVWLNNLYSQFLLKASESRQIDTATLHAIADQGKIRTANDALDNKLVDGLKYDDEVKDEIRSRLSIDKRGKINFVTIGNYLNSGGYKARGDGLIALIYAEGEIVDGKGDRNSIGSEEYIQLIRKARLDKSVRAIVFRINSGGGSAMASETIWRELSLAEKEKPLVVSFGDVAASGGYYIASAADSIFAQPNTITGSIGVFGIIPNFESFFKNKSGVTFDGVKTSPFADIGVYRPLNDKEKEMIQQSVDLIYQQFKRRVAEGRKKDIAYIDSIGQGRVWSGNDALRLGLIDRFGGLQDAVNAAANMAHLKSYRLREYPKAETFFERLFGSSTPMNSTDKLKVELGEENYKIFQEMISIRKMVNTPQARLPFEFFIR
jgi:protease IV